jgi:hypothetical protein
MKYYTMPETRAFLESIGMPGGDWQVFQTGETGMVALLVKVSRIIDFELKGNLFYAIKK